MLGRSTTMKLLVTALLAVFSFADMTVGATTAAPSVPPPCTSLSGLWRDSVRGYTILLRQSVDGKLTGLYSQSTHLPWSPANTVAEVIGFAPVTTTGTTFAITSLYAEGSSAMVWTAQCIMYGDVEMIQTIWLSQRQTTSCADQWQSTLTGNASFALVSREPDSMSAFEERVRLLLPKKSEIRRHGAADESCSIFGTWHNELGSTITITRSNDDEFNGFYHTAVSTLGEGLTAIVHGQTNVNNPRGAKAFFVNWNRSFPSTTAWVGSCQPRCGENNVEYLTTTWVLRNQVTTYENNWDSTSIGTDIFARSPRVPEKTASAGTP